MRSAVASAFSLRSLVCQRGTARLAVALAMFCAVLALSACGQRTSTTGPTIAVIPKGTSHVFWQSIHAGAEKAAREVGATIIWRGPLREDDRTSQISEVEGFISRGVAGIVVARRFTSSFSPA